MSAAFFKRSLMFSIPVAVMNLVFQYFQYGKPTVYSVAVTLFFTLLAGFVFEALRAREARKFGDNSFASKASAIFWGVAAVGLFAFFCHAM